MEKIREKAFSLCAARLHAVMAETKQELAGLHESLSTETRSTAGDKHETGRARMQAEEELVLKRLALQQDQLEEIERLRLFRGGDDVARPGCLVETNAGFYLLAVPPCRLSVEGLDIQVVSPRSPFGKLLTGLGMGAEFTVREVTYRILGIV